MSIIPKIVSLITSFDKDSRKQWKRKSGIVWWQSNEKNLISPLLYISKPKMVSQEDFDEILSKLEIKITK